MENTWYIVYKEITNLLLKYYKNNQTNAGENLYKIFCSDPDFIQFNQWILKFGPNFGTESIDPIHVFASINGNTINSKKRIERINILLRLLKSKNHYNEIDFTGCPAPTIINLISPRTFQNQNEIWDIFNRVCINPNNINSGDFEKIDKWFGVGFTSFTLFLFWIDSDNFLPLDSNTIGFLLATKKIDESPKDYNDYQKLLEFKSKVDFKELSIVAFKVMNENKQEIIYSDQMSLFLEKNKSKNVSTTSFKIVALKVHKYKNIENIFDPNKYYVFFDCFNFINSREIDFIEKNEINIYNILNKQINISAIVGKNGSGKSTLSEIIFVCINNLYKKALTNTPKAKLKFVKEINVELFLITDTLYRIDIKGTKINVFRYNFDGKKYIEDRKVDLENFVNNHFFYTIAINYSHHSLNSNITGKWLDPLFHKNDSYQTPLVINPMRNKGNIDINNENLLVISRLLTMILYPLNLEDKYPIINSFRNLASDGKNHKIAEKFEISFNNEKLRSVKIENFANGKYRFEYLEAQKDILLKNIYDKFDIKPEYFNSEDYIYKYSNEYILSKINKIKKTYRQYDQFLNSETKEIIDLDGFLSEINNNPSHITFKLYQAINFLRFEHLKEFKSPFNTYKKEVIVVSDLSDRIQKIRSEHKEIKVNELIPPSFFNVKVLLKSGLNETLSSFDDLSSGEKQKIFSISSIIYHLINLDSVVPKDKIIAYKNVQVIFDEIELYYHPELQRKFIYDLMQGVVILQPYLERIQDINFLFITHSPFILSDIPKNNVLFLNDYAKEKPETFGANIHELLSTGFFLENGFSGEFAKNEIMKLIEEIKNVNHKKLGIEDYNELEKRISLIGEPFIRTKLNEMLSSVNIQS